MPKPKMHRILKKTAGKLKGPISASPFGKTALAKKMNLHDRRSGKDRRNLQFNAVKTVRPGLLGKKTRYADAPGVRSVNGKHVPITPKRKVSSKKILHEKSTGYLAGQKKGVKAENVQVTTTRRSADKRKDKRKRTAAEHKSRKYLNAVRRRRTMDSFRRRMKI